MPKNRKPSYLLHRPTGQARVRFGGRDHYLGEYGGTESKQRYEKIVADWLGGQDPRFSLLTVDDLALSFCAWGEDYYRRSDGTPTGELRNIRKALEPLTMLFGNTLLRDFGPLRLKASRSGNRFRKALPKHSSRSGRQNTKVCCSIHRMRAVSPGNAADPTTPAPRSPEKTKKLREAGLLR